MAINFPKPPRTTGNEKTDLALLANWAWDFFQAVVLEAKVPEAMDTVATLVTDLDVVEARLPGLDAIASLTPLAITVSNPPTQAEVQAIHDKINEVIAAASVIAVTA